LGLKIKANIAGCKMLNATIIHTGNLLRVASEIQRSAIVIFLSHSVWHSKITTSLLLTPEF